MIKHIRLKPEELGAVAKGEVMKIIRRNVADEISRLRRKIGQIVPAMFQGYRIGEGYIEEIEIGKEEIVCKFRWTKVYACSLRSASKIAGLCSPQASPECAIPSQALDSPELFRQL